MSKIKVVHYINQFFAQIGGEEKADYPAELRVGEVVGPGMALMQQFKDEAEIVATIVCGDSYFNENLDKAKADILEMVKSQNPDIFIAGPAFNAGRAEEEHFLIIEDDYNSEFKYFQKPVPSLQGLSGGRNVIYLGTFSKMLLPSIRISYMILPPELMETYEKRKNNYNQTASKAEQIALTQFIRDGHLASQVRKSRKIHLAKAEKLAESIHKVFGDTVNVKIGEAGFMVQIIFSNGTDVKKVEKAARKEGLTFREAEGHTLLLTCAGVESDKYEEAMQILAKCVIIDNMK